MKSIVSKLALAVVMLFAPLALQAQTDQITGGYAVFTFTSLLLQQLASAGATLTDLSRNPLQNGALTLPSVQGVIDTQNGNGDLVFRGGYQVVVQGTTIRVEDLAFTINGPSAVFTGIFVVNGQVAGRQDIFTVNQKPNFILPLQQANGTLTLPQLSLGLTPAFLNLINQAAGQTVVSPGTQVGTASAFPVVVPDAPVSGN